MIRRRLGASLVLSVVAIAASACGAGVTPLTFSRAQMTFEAVNGAAAPASSVPTGQPAAAPALGGIGPTAPPLADASAPPPAAPVGGSGGGSAGGGASGGGSAGGGGAPVPDTLPTDPAPTEPTATEPTPTPDAASSPVDGATPTPAPDGATPTPTPAGATPTPTPAPTATPTPALTLVTWVGSGAAGRVNATGKAARFNLPYGVSTDAAGNAYVADALNHCIRKVTPAGVVTTLAGSGQQGHVDGPAGTARFNSPLDVAVQADGTLYVADTLNHCIRKITPGGIVSTLAGHPAIAYDAQGYPVLSYPAGLAVTAGGTVYVADPGVQAIRAISPAGVVSNLAGQYWNPEGGLVDGTGNAAFFQEPMDVALDRQGNLIVADTSNHRLRKVTPAGVVTTIAGSGALSVWGGGFADGPAGTARFKRPYGVAVDAAGAIYVADKDNQRVRRLANGAVTTVAGTGAAGLSDGYGPLSRLNEPVGLAVDPQGRLVVADTANHVLRRLYP